ncbi:uncharacterized protein LOC128887654 [Hylaeus anthracinus]|uniref:uncharacterized protein LOC128887654 n=1 Tax=Hylaeus anthracinus TaxID=313031 RepID=UPI0023B92AB8|nr:uncharacterized protein LOC128887654 [Hylaeus anthracinus]
MLYKLMNIFVLFLAIQNNSSATIHRMEHHIDIRQYNASYYDVKTGIGLKAELEDSGRDPLTVKVGFRGLPCHCEQLTCSCCTGINMTAINFNRRACTKFTYDPSEFAIKLALSMNEREIYTNSFSVKNPPPLCSPMPYLPFASFCIRFFDMYTIGRNLHACIDLETRIVGSPILILHFNCVKVGADGISWSKPGNDSNAVVALQTKPDVSELEEYDQVDFEQQDLEVYVNYTQSTLSPEQEALIGQLKL